MAKAMAALEGTLRAVALVSIVVGLASAGSPWGVGWGFVKHGGLPPQPAAMQSYWLNRSVAGYFVANSTGLANHR